MFIDQQITYKKLIHICYQWISGFQRQGLKLHFQPDQNFIPILNAIETTLCAAD
jgi:hypothetical protein